MTGIIRKPDYDHVNSSPEIKLLETIPHKSIREHNLHFGIHKMCQGPATFLWALLAEMIETYALKFVPAVRFLLSTVGSTTVNLHIYMGTTLYLSKKLLRG